MAKKNTSNCQYTKLSQINFGYVNVIGVVKFLKLPTATRGTDFIQVFSIIDDSLDTNDRIVITLFYKDKAKFPPLFVGDIIRFHRLKVENFNDEKRGKNGCGFAWLLVRHDADQPVASSPSFSYSESCKQRVRELLTWSEKQVWPQLSKLDCVVADHYIDLLCQVVGRGASDTDSSVILRVWDGTQCALPLLPTAEGCIKADLHLAHTAADWAVDVHVFGSHVAGCADFKPGDLIKFVNLHAMRCDDKVIQNADSPRFMLCLHNGTSFGRCVQKLDPSNQQAINLRHTLEFLESSAHSQRDDQHQTFPVGHSGRDGQHSSDTTDADAQSGDGRSTRKLVTSSGRVTATGAGRAEEALVQLATVVGRQYFDLVCLVIGCAVEKPGASVILRVWDGTRCSIPLVPSVQQQWEIDAELQRMVGDMAVDVYVFDNHTLSCKSIKAGSFIRLVNLHAWQYKEDMPGHEARDSPSYMLCLHRGCAFQRGLNHMDPLSPPVMALKHRLRQLRSGSGAGSPSASASVSSLPVHRSAEKPGTSSTGITHMLADVSKDGESSSGMGGAMVTGLVVNQGQTQDRDGCRQLTVVRGHSDLSPGSDTGQHHAPTQLTEMPAPAMSYNSGTVLSGLATHTETELAKDFVSGETLHSANDCFKVPFQLPANRATSVGSDSIDSQAVGALSLWSQPTGTSLEMGGTGSQPGETTSQQDGMEAVFPSPMCMLQTATVVCGHPGSGYTSIKAVRRHPVPGKFRLLAHLVAFHPDTLDPPGHVQHFCSQCTYLCSARGLGDDTSSLEPGRGMEHSSMEHRDTESMIPGKWGGAFADWSRRQEIVAEGGWPGHCPRCVTAGQPVKLELIYMLRMILRDYHGDFLVANLWQHNAVKFFNNVSPQTAFEQGQLKEQVLRLKQMCLGIPLPPDAACMPRMLDCCLMSYTTPHGTAFHIFDTVLV